MAAGDGTAAMAPAVGARRDVVLGGQVGDLYRSPVPMAALVMVPGVTPEGRDDPRLIAFAASLAEHGFLVFVPELPGLRQQRVGRDDPPAIAAAVDALATCFPAGEQPRLAVAAISYAVAPALVAATLPGARERIGLVIGIGGYHSAIAAVTYITTGRYRPGPGSPWVRGDPRPIARWVFLLAGAAQLPDPQDRAILSAIGRAGLADPTADPPGLAAGLGPGGRAMLELALNRDPDRVPALLAALPAPVRAEIAALDPVLLPLERLSARLLLIHGRDDPVIPASESRALAAAVPPGNADVYVVGNLGHVDIGPGGLADTLLLWQASYRLLAQRDGLSVPAPARCALATTSAPG